jgi:hypothetical protein
MIVLLLPSIPPATDAMFFDIVLFGDLPIRVSIVRGENDSGSFLECNADGPGTVKGGQQIGFGLAQFNGDGLVFHGILRKNGKEGIGRLANLTKYQIFVNSNSLTLY